ncbi:hypothetical protein EJB05_13851, partial [Eragrostis curvula]
MTPPRRPPPAALMEELVEEILLRFPPDDPARLFRAAVVCKCWHRLICGRGFRRRFREFHHRTPPLLGLICRSGDSPHPVHGGWIEKTHFMPTSTFRRLPSAASISDWRAIDTLHGRVLFWDTAAASPSPAWPYTRFLVWSPSELRMLPYICLARYTWSAALLCVTAGCDHLDSTSSDAFAVVFAGTDSMTTSAYVYSSEQDSWSEPVSIQDRYYTIYGPRRPGPLVGNTIYFTCFGGANKLMAFDLRKRQLSFISLPSVKFMDYHNIALIAVDEGKKLGFATAQGSKLFTWSTDDAGGLDEVVAWTRHQCSNVEQHPIPCPCHAKPYMSETMEPKSK